MQRRYQIFISSTYKDLKEERKEVIKAILKSYNFPIGMEMFHADDEEQWLQISNTIDMSDYYILILGKYCGTVLKKENRSYTEKEYDYAISKGIPVLAFIIDDSVRVEHYEETSKQRKIYKKFRKKVEKLPRELWYNKEDLALKVMNALYLKIAENKRNGWMPFNPVEMLERKDIPSTVIGEYILVYLSAKHNNTKKLIYSTLDIDKKGNVIFKNNIKVKDNAEAEFTYKGIGVVEDNTIHIRMKNDMSNEKITMELISSVGNLKRFIGLMLGSSPNADPACVKVACYKKEIMDKVNIDELINLLNADNLSFNKNVTTIEEKDKTLFFYDHVLKI